MTPLAWGQPFSWRGREKARSTRDSELRAAAKALLAADPAISEWRDLCEYDPRVIAAVVLAEDRHFWRHHGIDWSAVRAATIKNLLNRRIVFGASTIPMQVARMLQGWSKPTYARKLRESLLALWLVARHERATVLEVYVNLLPVVSGTRGLVAGGSQLIGRNPCRQLSVFEATLVAAAASVCPDTSSGSIAHFSTWLNDKQMRLVEDLVESGDISAREAAEASVQIARTWASSDEVRRERNDSRAVRHDSTTPARFLGSSADRARRRAIGWALAQIGTTEKPAGDGAAEVGTGVGCWLSEFGMSGVGWCGAFVGYALRVVAGIREIDVRVVWAPHVLEDAIEGRLGWRSVFHPRDALPGDVALFSWDRSGDPEHLGFVVANDQAGSILHTVEGNTTRDGRGDESDGGGVFLRERPYDVIVACARPRY